MPAIQAHSPGSFCWAEVGTIDPARTKAFYSELFGWTYEDKPAGEFGTYTMVKLRGQDLAGLFVLPPAMRSAGVPPHWMSYIAVADADAACQKIQQHGGKVQQGPFDVMDVGRMAVCQDPTGATFSVWQARKHKGCAVMGDKGTPGWFELATRGVDKAVAFYKAVFGWSVKAGNDSGMVYHEFNAAGAHCPQGGMMEMPPQLGSAPPSWTIYFPVDDCDADVERARGLGGKVLMPPMDIPKVGRFAVLADPAGAVFSIIKLNPLPAQAPATREAAAPKAAAPAKPRKK